jgi:iron complex outermembrane receptor protein
MNASPTLTLVPALRHFGNVAPEASLVWQADPALRLHARVGTAYGIPQSGQLFVTPAGVPGDNTDLRTQKNTGVDLGAELAIGRTLTAELTGYYEWFRNEQVTQSAGVNLLSFTANAPRSIHRGVEVAAEWRPDLVAGSYVRVNYSYNDQRYTRYVERLTSGAVSAAFDRNGNRIPGVIPSFANARLGYDRPARALAGLGGFAELTWRSRYWIDNANLLRVPGYALVNLNVHYDPPAGSGWWSRLSFYASIENLTDKTYVGSASIIADSLAANGTPNPASVLRNVTGSLYAGQPRTVYAGIKGRF